MKFKPTEKFLHPYNLKELNSYEDVTGMGDFVVCEFIFIFAYKYSEK